MSHTPLASSSDPSLDYVLGWKATWRLVRAGKSWSGGERDCAFLNLGDGRFADVSSAIGFDSPGDGRALATTDWDQDGALDLWMTQRDGPRVVFYRNQRPRTQHWIALRLEDAGKNRMAIGARVEVTLASGARLVREVAAGSGYLSQSSLEQHFGLGAATELAQIVVRWPGGERETFTGARADGRFVLARGSGVAQAIPPRATPVEPAQGALTAAREIGARRIEPLAPLPLVGLPWRTFDGVERALGDGAGNAARGARYQLVTLFTSTCASCAHELGALARSKPELDDVGLDVLALALDEDADAGNAKARLDAVHWPHASGRAGPLFLDALQIVLEELLDRPGALALPTNLLLDDSSRLVVLYRGPVDAATLAADVARLSAALPELPVPELPWPGRWILPPARSRDLLALASRLASGGHPAVAEALLGRLSIAPAVAAGLAPKEQRRAFDAFFELGHARAAAGDDRGAVVAFERALAAEPASGPGALALAGALRRLGQLDRAEERLDAARALLPAEHTALQLELAFMHAARGRDVQAEDGFARIVELDPGSGLAHLNLGLLRLARGAHVEALPSLAQAAALRPTDPEVRAQHAKALYLTNRYAEAVTEYEAALALRPEDKETIYNLALAAARSGRAQLALEQAVRLDALDGALAARLRALLQRAPR